MTIIIKQDAFVTEEVMQIVAHERAVALSAREWKHRLAGYGYSIRDTEDGKHVLETLPHHVALCELPDELFH
ncbi:hypothetical protein [Sulfitobacter guttiformis]|uniref:Uncharacterized protein n=1 Tax=Sulfitobacter guttiformis TaxID=74349 RepID=A0A420DS70_9RHOB|nr:hypothetical protein [Sulfitobacter guttiformis]KIN74515.1 30S ribosomal protein S21 [Sulfitobacter guttiformis KCTC 32187]RKE97105.1 hypothetical protein C8N30_1691 [Sulfitobacter guttiformis]